MKDGWKNRRSDYDADPYLKLMEIHPRVPHWWYIALLLACTALSIGTLYGAGLQLPWWGFLVISFISFIFTFPNGILFGVANMQVGMAFLSEVITGGLFAGQPVAVLSALSFGRQILEQNLNLISDYKFGFYMKIPEKEMFIGQVWGTLLGPFINIGMMRKSLVFPARKTLLYHGMLIIPCQASSSTTSEKKYWSTALPRGMR